MRTKFIVPLVLAAMGSLPCSEAQAKIWIVDGYGSGDFTQIQPAIDASQDGDVILVRVSAPFSYDTFVLSKGVMIRASDAPFTMVEDAEVYVRDITLGKRAGISGVSLSTGVTYHASTALHVDDCGGEVVLESVQLTAHDGVSSRLVIHNCDNVSMTSLDVLSGGVQIDNSYVRLSEVKVIMGTDVECGECVGIDAVQVTNSHIVLAGATVKGGNGSKGSWFGHAAIPGGDGGVGLRAANSSIIMVGPGQIHGGNGGDGGDDGFGNKTPGGDGGNGFDGDSGLASRMTFLGGKGGKGSPYGKDGAPWHGTLTEVDVVPYLAMTGGFHPGGAFQLDLDIVDAGALVFVFADHQGFVTVPGNPGPPLGAIPGGRFLTFYGGHLDALGHMTLPLVLPNDPALRGTPVNAQCAVLLDAGGFVLSNATTHVVGE